VLKEIGNVFRIGSSLVQIDIINEASGILSDDCFNGKNVITVEDVKISIICKEDLIGHKQASGRKRDLADAEAIDIQKDN